MAQATKKPVELINQAQDIERFTSILPRKYMDLETHRTFHTEEHWLTEDGSATVTDELTKETYLLVPGDLLICPAGSRLSRVASEEWIVKQYVSESDKQAINTRINVQVNWLIIQTLLKLLGKYDDFVEVPNETDILFTRAQQGDLYILDDYANYVDQCIDNFVDRTGISKDIWTGKARLRTGFKYTGELADKAKEDTEGNADTYYHIDYIDSKTILNSYDNAVSDRMDTDLYREVRTNPIGLPDTKCFDNMRASNLFTLRSLLLTISAHCIPDIDFIPSLTVPEYKLWQPYLTEEKMPRDIEYSARLETIINKLYEVNI